MVAKKPKIVIVGAGMAGLAAANWLHTATGGNNPFELCIVEGGDRLGGRILTTEFGGDRIEMGATWIHGIGGSPIYKIAQEVHGLVSDQPWERMDGFLEDLATIAEGGFEIDQTLVDPISCLYKKLMEFAQGKLIDEGDGDQGKYYRVALEAAKVSMSNGCREPSVGSFLLHGLDAYWVSKGDRKLIQNYGNWSLKSLEKAIFSMYENTERTYTSAGDLLQLDFNAEREYREFPDEQITIAKGYMSIIESLASVLPYGLIQLGRKVKKIEWRPEGTQSLGEIRPVKLHFEDDSIMYADHVIITVSLGVLKAGICEDKGMFSPPLPSFKIEAISRLGFGVVNKLFMKLDPTHDSKDTNSQKIPLFQMAFHQNPAFGQLKIPWWLRRTVSVSPIYKKSSVYLAWFAGKEALEVETLTEEEIIKGVSTALSSFSLNLNGCNGNVNGIEHSYGKITEILKSGWGTDPLFMGSYSFVAVGSSGEDLDSMAEPLPESPSEAPLQVMFAGEATHRTHYSTTHGAYFSGIREANRLLQHYKCELP